MKKQGWGHAELTRAVNRLRGDDEPPVSIWSVQRLLSSKRTTSRIAALVQRVFPSLPPAVTQLDDPGEEEWLELLRDVRGKMDDASYRAYVAFCRRAAAGFSSDDSR